MKQKKSGEMYVRNIFVSTVTITASNSFNFNSASWTSLRAASAAIHKI